MLDVINPNGGQSMRCVWLETWTSIQFVCRVAKKVINYLKLPPIFSLQQLKRLHKSSSSFLGYNRKRFPSPCLWSAHLLFLTLEKLKAHVDGLVGKQNQPFATPPPNSCPSSDKAWGWPPATGQKPPAKLTHLGWPCIGRPPPFEK
jgi:hypothetical protein